MRLEDYFDVLAPNDIRLRGHRIGIETILSDYLHLGLSAEEIAVSDAYAGRGLRDAYLLLA